MGQNVQSTFTYPPFHVDMNTLEKYKKLGNLTQAVDRHKAGLIMAGRQFLRGKIQTIFEDFSKPNGFGYRIGLNQHYKGIRMLHFR